MLIKISELKVVDHQFFADHQGGAFWCLHCERVHVGEKWLEKDKCPYPDCDGEWWDAHAIDYDFELGKVYPTHLG